MRFAIDFCLIYMQYLHIPKEEGSITDKEIANRLDISLRTLSEWKKTRVKLYERLRWSYEAENVLREIERQADEAGAKIKEVLQKSS